MNVFRDRGVRFDRTYQLNFGGITDSLNMLERGRLDSKKISKTNAVTSQPLAGQRVLVRCYHGLGDAVMFMRFMPLLKAIARKVIVRAQAALTPQLDTVEGIDRLLPLRDGTPECDYDVDIGVMEVAHAFRITVETLPSAVSYFSVKPALLLISPKLRVGLIWAAGGWDARRNVPVAMPTSLARTEGVEFHLLQRGAAIED